MTKEECVLRSETQYKLLNLNILTSGALAAFAFSEPGKVQALLVIPFVSFALCAHWISLGITIRLGDQKPRAKKYKIWQYISSMIHSLSVTFGFIFIPIVALLIYQDSVSIKPFFSLTNVIILLGYALSGISLILFSMWYYIQYIKAFPALKNCETQKNR